MNCEAHQARYMVYSETCLKQVVGTSDSQPQAVRHIATVLSLDNNHVTISPYVRSEGGTISDRGRALLHNICDY